MRKSMIVFVSNASHSTEFTTKFVIDGYLSFPRILLHGTSSFRLMEAYIQVLEVRSLPM